MPTLKEALNASRKGYTHIEASKGLLPDPPVPNNVLDEFTAHPLMRCPLPTPNVSSDTLRPFRTGDITPKRRMIAPDSALGQTQNGTVTNTTTVITTGSSSSSSSSASSSSSITAQNASIDTPLLATGQHFFGTISLASMFAILSCTVTSAARVQLYSTNAAQLLDAGRGQVPPAGTTQHGVIMDLYLDTPDKFSWIMSPIADGSNQDDPQTDYAYITVTNLAAAAIVSVTLIFVPEET